jgi:hypothetical protein
MIPTRAKQRNMMGSLVEWRMIPMTTGPKVNPKSEIAVNVPIAGPGEDLT